MHCLSYTKLRCFTNTLTCFGTRQHHLHGVPSQLLIFQHIKWFETTFQPYSLHSQYMISKASWWLP